MGNLQSLPSLSQKIQELYAYGTYAEFFLSLFCNPHNYLHINYLYIVFYDTKYMCRSFANTLGTGLVEQLSSVIVTIMGDYLDLAKVFPLSAFWGAS